MKCLIYISWSFGHWNNGNVIRGSGQLFFSEGDFKKRAAYHVDPAPSVLNELFAHVQFAYNQSYFVSVLHANICRFAALSSRFPVDETFVVVSSGFPGAVFLLDPKRLYFSQDAKSEQA
ncbi:hypothetical protein Tcan_00354, partial [Toxocara canis]